MEVKVPDPGPMREAIDSMQLKPQYFFVAGVAATVIAAFNWPASTGLGIAGAGAFIGAAWLQSVIMKGFIESRNSPAAPPAAPPPPTTPQPAPPKPPLPEWPASIDLEPTPKPQNDFTDSKYPR